MKNKIKFLGIIAIVAVIGFTFAACDLDGGSSGSSRDSALAAEWYVDEETSALGIAYEFKSNGDFHVAGSSVATMTWSTSGGKMTMKAAGYTMGTADYSISGKVLTLSNVGSSGLSAGTYYKK